MSERCAMCDVRSAMSSVGAVAALQTSPITHHPSPIVLADASWLDRLFGLTRISLGDAETVLGWRYALPAWVWVAIIAAAAALAGWSYSRLLGPAYARGLLAGVRALLLIVVAALLAGPTLVRHDERIERDWLLVLIDRSASMQVRDKLDPATGEPMSRDAQLRAALARQVAVFDTAEGLAAQRHLDWLGFGAEVRPINAITAADDLDAWPDADEPATNIRTAIEQALQRAAGQPISGVVMFTDGQTPQATGAELAHRLQQRAVPVFLVPLGADPMPLDLAVGQIDHPRRAFVDDLVPVSATINRLSGEQDVDPAHVRVRLVDTATNTLLDEVTLAEAGAALNEPVRLVGRGRETGERQWRVEVRYDGPEDGQGSQVGDNPSSPANPDDPRPMPARELVTDNNQRSFDLELIDRPIRVLYVEGYPRWEYRYLKNLLVREESIESSMFLLSADRDFAQEGDVPIARLPTTAQELEPYDVVIVGDVPANYFTSDQVNLLRDHVAAGGAGLLWIGGERSTPVSYADTPLASLLPMRRPEAVRRLGDATRGVEMRPTPAAHALRVLTLYSPGEGDAAPDDAINTPPPTPEPDAAADWPEHLPALYWAQALGQLKPAAEPLALTRESGADGRPDALIVRLRYGAGRSLYVASDDTWRWRYGRGDWYYQQYWLQLVRKLGRARVQEGDRLVELSVSQQRVDSGQPVVVELVVRDPALLERELGEVTVDVHRAPDDAGDAPEYPQDLPRVDRFELRQVDADTGTGTGTGGSEVARRVYRATWQPSDAGALALRINEPAFAGLELHRRLEVVAPDDELRRPQPDHDRLHALADATGGAVIDLHQLDTLPPLVPNRDRRVPSDVSEPLWNSALALIVILVLLTLEWVLRKVIRLV